MPRLLCSPRNETRFAESNWCIFAGIIGLEKGQTDYFFNDLVGAFK